MKRCPKCGQTKPFSDFYSDRTSKAGYRSWCKACISVDPGTKASHQRYWASDAGKAAKRRFRQNHLTEVRAEDEARRQADQGRLL